MKIFISGGCKNGKSTLAQHLAVKQRTPGTPLYYIATMLPADREDFERVARHRLERAGMGFTTVELPRQLSRLPQLCRCDGSFLLDSLTALLSNEMFGSGPCDTAAPQRVAAELSALLAGLSDAVIVSDTIYGDVPRYTREVELYQKGLALLDRTCAGQCDIVAELCGGIPLFYKGKNRAVGLLQPADPSCGCSKDNIR